MDDSTDFRLGGRPAPDSDSLIPLRPGDRATVSGIIRPDGTVVADTVRVGPGDAQGVTLVGRVVRPAGRYGSRDIQVRSEDGSLVMVHVPDDVPVTRDDQPVSVHDLSEDDVVRVECFPDGDAVQATRISVVRGDK